MTDVDDVERKKKFDSLRDFLNKYDSVAEAEKHNKKGDFTRTQAKLFAQYYQGRHEKMEQKGIQAAFFKRSGKRIRAYRDKKGRFVHF